MKLLMCPYCKDVFKLDIDTMRYCKCGKVKGRYIDNIHAEVSKEAISVAIGNDALVEAIVKAQALYSSSEAKASREEYVRQASISHAWIRPNEGKGNPHSKIIT